jgi:hypothetical protein
MAQMTERLISAMSPILQQRFSEQVALLVAEHNQQGGAAVLELRMTPDEVQLVSSQPVQTNCRNRSGNWMPVLRCDYRQS